MATKFNYRHKYFGLASHHEVLLLNFHVRKSTALICKQISKSLIKIYDLKS